MDHGGTLSGLLLAAALGGCSCGGCETSVPARDAGAGGHDAGRDGAPDAAADAGRDSGGNGSCPDGETLALPVPVPHDGDPEDCGAGCTMVTWVPRGVQFFDVDAQTIAYSTGGDDLGFVDLATDQEFSVPFEGGADEETPFGGPIAVDGRFLVYSSCNPTRRVCGVWRYDLVSHCRRQLRELDAGDEGLHIATWLDASDGWAVWNDDRAGQGHQDLFSFDLSGGRETRLTSYGCCVGPARLWRGQAAFVAWPEGPYGILTLPVAGGEPRRLWDDPREQGWPAIHENRVVFAYAASRFPDDWDVTGFDLATGAQFPVVATERSQEFPDVFGDIAVWQDRRNDPVVDGPSENTDIYARDLAKGVEMQVTALPGLEIWPRVWDRRVYFYAQPTDARPPQIYRTDLPE